MDYLARIQINSVSLWYYNKKERNVMLGMNSKRTLIAGEFADEIKNRVRRIQTGELTKRDREEIRKGRQVINKVSIVWK